MISQDASKPNVFEFTLQAVVPAGTETIDITSWQRAITPIAVPFTFYAEATGYLDGTVFRGRYDGRMLSRFNTPFMLLSLWLFMRGTYEVEIEAA